MSRAMTPTNSPPYFEKYETTYCPKYLPINSPAASSNLLLPVYSSSPRSVARRGLNKWMGLCNIHVLVLTPLADFGMMEHEFPRKATTGGASPLLPRQRRVSESTMLPYYIPDRWLCKYAHGPNKMAPCCASIFLPSFSATA